MSAIELENLKEYNELLKNTPHVIVLAHGQFAAASRAFKSEFQDIAKKHTVEGQVAFAWYNAFDADDINDELVVRNFPAYFVFHDGQRVKQVLSSNASKERLEQDVAELAEQMVK